MRGVRISREVYKHFSMGMLLFWPFICPYSFLLQAHTKTRSLILSPRVANLSKAVVAESRRVSKCRGLVSKFIAACSVSFSEIYGLSCVYVLAYAFFFSSTEKNPHELDSVLTFKFNIIVMSRCPQYKAFHVLRMDGSKFFNGQLPNSTRNFFQRKLSNIEKNKSHTIVIFSRTL